MKHEDAQVPPADAGRLETPVRPCAWLREQRGEYEGPATLAPLMILGHSKVRPHASNHGATYEPLYDQAALDAALALWPRDCRLCAHYRDGLTHAAHCVSVLRCEDSSAYRATQPVQFWEKRPAEQAPF
jgi:hypothetical protein